MVNSLIAFAAFSAAIAVTPGADSLLVLGNTRRGGSGATASAGPPARLPGSLGPGRGEGAHSSPAFFC